MITAEQIRQLGGFELVNVSGRAIFPDDPMVNSGDERGYCGCRITKLVKGADLFSTVRRWDSMGRIIDGAEPF